MTETKNTATGNGLYVALAKLQADLPSVGKDKTGKVQGKDGKQGYSYSYADLADVTRAVMPLLGKHGLAFTARPTLLDGQFVLAYSLVHGESGQREDGFYPLPSSGTPQQIGGVITYARRYSLCAVTGVAPDNDDDDAAAGNQPQQYSRGESWRSQPPVKREESRPAEPSADVDDGDWADWPDAIKAIASQEDADKLDAELREAFKAQRIGPTKANNIRQAIKDKAASLTADAEPERDMVAQRLGGEATAAQDTAALRKVHQAAMEAGKLQAFITLENGYAGTLLSYITARKAELEPAKDGQAAAK